MDPTVYQRSSDKVRAPGISGRVDADADHRLREAAALSTDGLSQRITQLDQEWDLDRNLEMQASLIGLAGLVLSVAVDKRLWVPAAVSAMLVLHATDNWSPLRPLFRRGGVRTRGEIDRERYGLKALRGDFAAIQPAGPADERVAAAWKAVCR
jgi:hypothetical protein